MAQEEMSPTGSGPMYRPVSGSEESTAAEESVSLDPGSTDAVLHDRLEKLTSRTSHAHRYGHRGEIARGGMGMILKIWDDDLRRHLAMKVILATTEEGVGQPRVPARALQRFLDEAQISSQLDHPGVVPVHELGIDHHGSLYFGVRKLDGQFEAHAWVECGGSVVTTRDAGDDYVRLRAYDGGLEDGR